MSVLLMLSLAFAQEIDSTEKVCDPIALSKVISTSTGDAAAEAFSALVICDLEKALHFAKTTIITFIPSKVGYEAAVTAMKIGADAYVIEWMNTKLEPDEQKRALRLFGEECSNDTIQEFFLNAAKNDPQQFWGKRYYQYLTTCNSKDIDAIFIAKIDEGTEQGRSQYFAVISAYSRNMEASSIPKLVELLQSDDGEVQGNVIAAIYEAIDETAKNNPDNKKMISDASNLGIKAIVSAGPKLEVNALNQARITLNALEAEAEADEMAANLYKPKKQEDGSFMWGLVVVENATCKKGKLKQRIQSAQIVEQGNTWADQLEERVQDSANHAWEVNLAEGCKGEGEVRYFVPEAPFSNVDEYTIWADTIIKENRNTEVKKVILLAHDPLSI